MDFKGWWYDEAKRRCEPLTVRDEHTRYVLELRRMKDARSETVRRVFERLFVRYGLPQMIRSDNRSPFAATSALLGLSRLSAWWVALGIDLERSRPGHPQDNGAHERLHRDISLELEGVSGTHAQGALDLWREQFNHERPHEALAMRTPGELYIPATRQYRGTPEALGRQDHGQYDDRSRERHDPAAFISGISLVSRDATTDATDRPGLAARENEE